MLSNVTAFTGDVEHSNHTCDRGHRNFSESYTKDCKSLEFERMRHGARGRWLEEGGWRKVEGVLFLIPEQVDVPKTPFLAVTKRGMVDTETTPLYDSTSSTT